MPGPLLPFVSVVVPTHDRAHHFERCLASLCRQDYPVTRYEIVVADDGSADDTARVVERVGRETSQPAVRYVRQAHRGLNAARNLALAHGSGDPICFVDDDDDVPPTWLAARVDGCLRHPRRAASAARRHFARGRGQALNGHRIGRRFSIVRTSRELRGALAHALRHRCTVGSVSV